MDVPLLSKEKMEVPLLSKEKKEVPRLVEPVVTDGLKQSCWANIPQEFLRQVLARIEASESSWPARRSVVACAGVCRTWRLIMKGIVNTLQVSSKITFPISVKQHGPREDNPLQCFVKRNRSTQTYYLFLSLTNALSDDGKFLLAARRCRRVTGIDYIISLDADDMSKGSNTYVGKLRSNFLRNKFTIYDGQPPHKGAKTTKSHSIKHGNLNQVSPKVSICNYPVAHISYMLGSRYARLHSARNLTSWSPRRMKCVMDTIPASAIQPGGVGQPIQGEFSPSKVEKAPLFPFFRSKSNRIENSVSGSPGGDKVLVLKSKSGFWSEQFGCWCFNFKGRVNVKSAKNCQLVASPENGPSGEEHKKIILQFGKVGKDLFTMDYQYPISAFQAFAICLSRFETQILFDF